MSQPVNVRPYGNFGSLGLDRYLATKETSESCVSIIFVCRKTYLISAMDATCFSLYLLRVLTNLIRKCESIYQNFINRSCIMPHTAAKYNSDLLLTCIMCSMMEYKPNFSSIALLSASLGYHLRKWSVMTSL